MFSLIGTFPTSDSSGRRICSFPRQSKKLFCLKRMYKKFVSVVDQHRFDAHPDPNYHFDADRDPDPDWHQKRC
jgi:hypothetical protein